MTELKQSDIVKNMDNSDKKSRWSKKQIIGIVADDIDKNGKLRSLITQVLKSKSKADDISENTKLRKIIMKGGDK